ncbi:unnamed protein product [Clonostachys solani]|uniref:Uncharacterized protein n=1 Tax=Clonostachys solani TaxID=160281 RepID=A0A9N9ZPV5_9HYPO|nr:unnamed protein product [Clonostachys solani]
MWIGQETRNVSQDLPHSSSETYQVKKKEKKNGSLLHRQAIANSTAAYLQLQFHGISLSMHGGHNVRECGTRSAETNLKTTRAQSSFTKFPNVPNLLPQVSTCGCGWWLSG